MPFARVSLTPVDRWEDAPIRRGRAPERLPDGAQGLAVSDERGRFEIAAIAAGDAPELPLPPGWIYEVTVYKTGFHLYKDSVAYAQGELDVDVTLYPDTIDLDDVGNLVDTSLGTTNTGAGVLRQGE